MTTDDGAAYCNANYKRWMQQHFLTKFSRTRDTIPPGRRARLAHWTALVTERETRFREERAQEKKTMKELRRKLRKATIRNYIARARLAIASFWAWFLSGGRKT